MEKSHYMDNKEVIMPCRALAIDMELIRVRLSKLSFFEEADLLQGLEKSLSPCRQILDVDIFAEPVT